MRTKNIFDPCGLQEMLYVVVNLMISLAIYPGGDLDLLGYFLLGKGSLPPGLRDLSRPLRGELCLGGERQRKSNRYYFNKSSLELIHKMSSFYFVLYTVTILFIELDCV